MYIEPRVVNSARAWQQIEQLRQRLRKYPNLPKWRRQPAWENSRLLWWFLKDRRLIVQEAEAKLVKCLTWREEFRVERLGPELFAKEMRTRKGYVHQGVDIAGRPVLVAVARRHNIFERSLLESTQMCAWMLETALERLAMPEPPGPNSPPTPAPEQALGIFDLRGFSPLQADLEVSAFLIEVLYNYYPGRTGRVLLVGAPEIFKSFWEGIRPLLGRYAALADFVTVDELCKNYFAPGCAPAEFAAEVSPLEAGAGSHMSARTSARLPRFSAGGGLSLGLVSSLAFVGATLSVLPQRFRGRRRRSSAACRATHLQQLDVGSQQMAGAAAADAATVERSMSELREHLSYRQGLKWHGRPAAMETGLLWWFLRDRRLDVAEAAAKLIRCLKWREAFRVERLGPELFAKEMRTKKAYLHEHLDVADRPAIVVIASRHSILERKLKESCSMCAWFMEQTLERLASADPFKPGGHEVEQALAVVDLRGFTPLQADLEFVGFMIEVIHNYYPSRFARILLVDAPDGFESFWNSICPLLHRYQKLAEFVSARDVCDHYFAPGLAPAEFQR